MFLSKYVQFRINCSLLCSIIVDIFEVDLHLIQYEKLRYIRREHSRLAEMIANKTGEQYSKTISWIRATIYLHS